MEYCEELAADHKGWDGDKTWQSAGADIALSANHDQVNTTRLTATLHRRRVPPWTASCELHVDPYRFDRVAKNLALYGEELFGDEYDEDAQPERRDPRKIAGERFARSAGAEPGALDAAGVTGCRPTGKERLQDAPRIRGAPAGCRRAA